MATAGQKTTEGQRSLLRFLQREGKVAAADVMRLEQEAQKKGVTIFEVLEAEGVIAERDLAALLATTLRLRLVDLTSYPFDPQMARELKEAIATRYDIVPIRVEDRTIEVATANPLDLDGLKAVEFATGKRVQALVATRQEVQDALAHVYRLQESLDQFLQHVPDESLTVNELRDQGGDLRSIAREAELPPVVKLADLILIEGIKSRASDVHIEPGTDAVAVRYRIDGILEESFRFPKWVQNALLARLKVMAKLDITERRVPQDGRIQLRYQERVVDLRVSSLPAQHGEKITLRILDANAGIKTLDRLGFNEMDLQRMRDAIRKPEGLILITGPTGSGKTTTLYALLREKISPNLNIVTIENPIEYQLKGINQVEVNEKQGLTFAGVLRSVLRQDPDVILVGEIRDKETAQIAMQAAQTGHLVLSTVHTNDATAAVTRLIDLGVEPFVVASTMHLVLAQRLVRRICPSCSEPYTPPEDSQRLLRLDADALPLIRRGKGCQACRQSGFSGRTAVYEVLPISPAITKLIEQSSGESAMRAQGRAEGYTSVVDSAREKLLAGLTTPEEVLRVVQVNDYVPRCPGCAHEIADEYTTCPHCGTTLRTMCGGCGKPLTAGWTACPYCGTKPAGTVDAVDGARAPDAVAARALEADAALPEESPVYERSYKALVVDDNAAIRDIVRMTLERSTLGLSVVLAEDGNEALALAAIERPDIVVLDLQMPGLDGFEVCRRLRSDVRTAFVPVIMLTAQTAEESVTKGFAAGTDDYVTKPFRRDDLVARVRRTLERTYGKDAFARGAPAAATKPAADAAVVRPSITSSASAPAPAPVPAPAAVSASAVASAPAIEETGNGAAPAADSAVTSDIDTRLAALSARLDSELADIRRTIEEVRGAQQRVAIAAVEPELDEIRATLEQIRENQKSVLANLREASATGTAAASPRSARQKSKDRDSRPES